MTTAKNILGVVPGLQATALVGHNLKLIPKRPQKITSKQQIKKFIKVGTTNLVGISLMKPTAKMINDL